MEFRTIGASIAASAAMIAMPLAASALSVSCVGTPGASFINWAASSANATGTVSYLWGNGSTSANMLISVTPGTYTMSLQGTDASSTIATTTCSATVAAPATTTPPSGVSAQVAALLAQINALKAQIAALLASQGVGTTTPPVLPPGLGNGCDRIGGSLSRGARGGDVSRLQQFLANQGLMASSTVTGTFGSMTEKALKRLQQANGIGENGMVGTSTRAFMQRHCEGGDDRHPQGPMGGMMGSSTKPAIVGVHGDDENEGPEGGRGAGRGPRGMMRINGATSTPWDGEHGGPNRF